MKTKKPKTIKEAINDLQVFLESDLWYAFHTEIKTEEDMIKYLQSHFNILKSQLNNINKGVINNELL